RLGETHAALDGELGDLGRIALADARDLQGAALVDWILDADQLAVAIAHERQHLVRTQVHEPARIDRRVHDRVYVSGAQADTVENPCEAVARLDRHGRRLHHRPGRRLGYRRELRAGRQCKRPRD